MEHNEQGFVSVWALKNYCSTLAQMLNRKQKVELLTSAHIAQNPLLSAVFFSRLVKFKNYEKNISTQNAQTTSCKFKSKYQKFVSL